MPWTVNDRFNGGQLLGQGIESAAKSITEGGLKALQKFEEDKKQRAFNDATIEHLQDYVPAEQLQKYHSMNLAQQSGVVAGAFKNATMELAKKHQDAEDAHLAAQTNLAEAQANSEWTGQGSGGTLDLTPEEIATGSAVGKVPLRQSPKSFQWAEDPNNPANLGMAPPTPVDEFGRPVDPNSPKAKVAGLQQSNGVIKLFPKPTQLQELVNMGLLKLPGAAAEAAPSTGAAAKPAAGDTVKVSTPGEAQALPKGTRYQTPDGQVYIR